jgi:hypothetical protein
MNLKVAMSEDMTRIANQPPQQPNLSITSLKNTESQTMMFIQQSTDFATILNFKS